MTIQNLYNMFYDWMAEDTVKIYDGSAPLVGHSYYGYCDVPENYRDKTVEGFSYNTRLSTICIWLKKEQ